MQYNYFNNNMQYNPDNLRNNNSDDNRNELYNSFREGTKNGFRKVQNGIRNIAKKRAMKKAYKRAGKAVVAKAGGLVLMKWFAIGFALLLAFLLLVSILGNAQFKGKNKDYANDGTIGKGNTTTDNSVSYSGNPIDMQVNQFYQYSSNRSSWQLQKNGKLIASDDEKAVRDYYNRESQFNLTPAFLSSLDYHLFKQKFIYPEQFIQPLAHSVVDEVIDGKKTGRKTAVLKDLTDEKGNVVVESKHNEFKENESGELVKSGTKTEKSVANFGLGSIFRYQDAKKVLYLQGTYQDDVWHGSVWDTTKANVQKSKPVEYGPQGWKDPAKNYEKWYPGQPQNIDDYYGTDEFYSSSTGDVDAESRDRDDVEIIDYVISTDEDIHLIDDILTFMGKYTFTYRAVPQIHSELPESAREKQIGTFVYGMEEREREKTVTITDPVTNQKTQTKVKEKYFTAKTGTLFRHYEGNVYEIMPRQDRTFINGEDLGTYQERISKEDKTEKEEADYKAEMDKKFKYIRDYAENFEAYIPQDVMEGFDFEERVGTDYVLEEDKIGSTEIPVSVLQLEPIFAKYSNGNEILKNILMAKCAQESGGRNIYDDFDGSGRAFPAWGVMQIEDTSKGIYPYRRGTGKAFGFNIEITKDAETDERLDQDKAIRWASEHFQYLLEHYNGDMLKALQAYNYGVGGMDILVEYAESQGLSWLNVTDMMPTLLGKQRHGDPNYVSNVLKYYKGDLTALTSGENLGFLAGLWQKVGDMVKKYDLENQPLLPYRYSLTGYNFEYMMRDAVALENDLRLTEANYEDYGFLLDGNGLDAKAVNSYEDLQELVPTLGEFSTPLRVANPPMTSPFGWRIHPISKTRKHHNGIDISVPKGTPIYSIGDGVFSKNYDDVSGNYVFVTHSDGIRSFYCHMDSYNPNLKNGDVITAGTWIGTVGSTGGSTGNHLHFGIKANGIWIDSYYFAYPPSSVS